MPIKLITLVVAVSLRQLVGARAATLSGSVVGVREVNLELVRAGMAWWYRDCAREQTPLDRKLYEPADDEARKASSR